jgi:hypothetical protein
MLRTIAHLLRPIPSFVCLFALVTASPVQGQLAGPNATGSISGNVVDPQGAVIPHADIQLTHEGDAPIVLTGDDLGHYTASNLKPGRYIVEAQSPGFSTARKENILVAPGKALQLTLTLAIEVQQQQVTVSGSELDSSPQSNGAAIVLKGKDLDALSNDQSELQEQLQAMAGADPETGTQFYVDGFTAGRLPPKSSIREIRINSNPYSAQYDNLGYGRIEIFTKPGTDKLHGDYWMQGNDSSWNAKNPFVTTQPPYYSYQFEGDVNGPLTKNMSYFTSLYNQNSVNDSVVDATILDPTTHQQTHFTQAISSPSHNLDLSPRYDLQIGKSQTISIRYQLGITSQTNAGVGQFNLASQAFDTRNTEQVLQISDTQAYGEKIVNETRFQYMRNRNNQTAQNVAPVTISVAGAFTDGGNPLGVVIDNQDHYEFQDYLQINHGPHAINLGGRLRVIRDANNSTSNFNGQFTYATLDAYQITEQALLTCKQDPQNCPSAATVRAEGGGPSQFSQTQGNSHIAVSLVDAGIYAEDDWKIKPDVTFSYGLRFETQTGMHDHADFGPRTALSWAIPGGKNKPPRAVIRSGAGFFYTRFASTNLLQENRQNGVTESQILVNSPDYTCTTNPTACAADAGVSASSPTVYRVNPNLRAPYIFITGIGVDKPLGKYASISANYLFSRGEHLFLTRNINAPLPGTYNPADPTSGTRPLGTGENIYQFDSEGASARHRLVVNGNLHAKNMGLFGSYVFSETTTNTQGIGTFPSNSYNLRADYGQASFNLHHRLFLGGFSRLPYGIFVNPFIVYQSSTPFNITVGEDLNGDSIFNDRPAFATDLSRASVFKTKYGNFDSLPIPGQTIIPVNYGHGPSMFLANLRLGKEFHFGPIIPDENPPPPAPAPAASKDSKTEAKPAAKPSKIVKKEIERKYSLGIDVGSNNIFNHVNLGPPIGVLGSPLFGQSTSLSTIFGSGSANRTVNLETFFRF